MEKNNSITLFRTNCYLYIYKTENGARKARTHYFGNNVIDADYVYTDAEAVYGSQFWTRILDEKVHYSEMLVPILLVEKKYGETPRDEFWHVIIGEKIGWIYVDAGWKDIHPIICD